MLKNPSHRDLKLAINDAMNEIIRAFRDHQENTLLFVYYAGHGMMDQTTYCMLNSTTKLRYPIEAMLRDIAQEHGSYVVALLDCCREKIDSEMFTRGGGISTPAVE